MKKISEHILLDYFRTKSAKKIIFHYSYFDSFNHYDNTSGEFFTQGLPECLSLDFK